MPIDDDSELPTDPEVVAGGKKNLDKLYADMRGRRSFAWTDQENKMRRNPKAKIDGQMALLGGIFDEALGPDFSVRKYRANVKSRQMYEDKLSRWKDGKLKSGELVRLDANDLSQPYFCQQVGRGSGRSDNNPSMMYMRKEYLPFLGSVVELINYQIDLLNADPAAYGYPNLVGVHIPHISALKVSGAGRTLAHQYGGGAGGNATKKLSSHLVGSGLDLVALKPEAQRFKIVRFAQPLVIDGRIVLPAGEKLPAAGEFSAKTEEVFDALRTIVSRMTFRAIEASRYIYQEEEGVTVRPLWESNSECYHITLKPKSD